MRRLALLSLAAFTLAGCVRGFTGLEGRWTVDSINRRPVRDQLGPQEPLWMVFRRGELSGWEGCNHFGGPYVYEGDSVGVAWRPMTLIGCGRRSEEFMDVISSDPFVVTFDNTGMKMTITSTEGSVELSRDLRTRSDPRFIPNSDESGDNR